MFRRALKLKNLNTDPLFPVNISLEFFLTTAKPIDATRTYDTTFMSGYKTKYPDVSEESLLKRARELIKFKATFSHPDEIYEAAEVIGKAEPKMTEKERLRLAEAKKKNKEREIQPANLKEPLKPFNFWETTENGDVFHWNNVAKEFILGQSHKNLFDAYRDAYIEVSHTLEECNKIKDKNISLNWPLISEDIGVHLALKFRKDLNLLISQIPKFDFISYMKEEEDILNSWNDIIKDEYHESLLVFEERKKYFEHRMPLYQFDSYGTTYDFFSFEYLDTYETEFRDWILFRIEDQKWSVTPKLLKKAVNTNIDEISTTFSDRKLEESIVQKEKIDYDKVQDTNTIVEKNKREEELMELLKVINEQAEILKDIVSKVTELKTAYDTKMASKRKKAILSGQTKKKESKDQKIPDEEFDKLVDMHTNFILEAEKELEKEEERLQKRSSIF